MALRLPRAIGGTVSTESSENDLNALDAFTNELRKRLPNAVVDRVQSVFAAMLEAQTEEMEAKAHVIPSIEHAHFV